MIMQGKKDGSSAHFFYSYIIKNGVYITRTKRLSAISLPRYLLVLRSEEM